MKKIILAIFLAFSAFLYAESNFLNEYNYAEYTLENGMQIFVLEDFSSAPVQVEFSVHAGISAQNPATTGFFPLYTRLFKYGAEKNSFLQNLTSECSADSSNYRISVSQELVSSTFEILARCAFSPFFAEKDILREYSALKNEIMQYAPTPAAFINTAIDSRIFSETPWKLDSGIYPQIFTKSTAAEIRSILSRIGKFWYTPQNSAIFVSGPVKKEEIYALAEKTFGSYKPAASFALPEKVTATGKTRKFIMHDLQFSEDMTQIVIEYTGLNFNQASLAAVAYNEDSSTLKKSLCAEHILNIRGPEYINVSSTRHNGCARLIFQTLLEQNLRSPVEQAETFIEAIKKSPETTDPSEYQAARKILHDNFRESTANSTNFINSLAYFWAIDPLLSGNDEKEILLAQKLLSQPEKITSTNENSLKTSFENETPFIFVLVNTKNFKKYKSDYKRLGYEEINSKNGSWFTQELYKNALKEISAEKKEIEQQKAESESARNIFLEENRNSLKTIELSNGIPVTVKTNRMTNGVSILVSIDGGSLADKNRPGFQNVMANAIASNIRKEIIKYKTQQIISGNPAVYAETSFSDSKIIVECEKEDISLCIRSISDALIFGEITPAEADSYVYSAQTQKRLSGASPLNQMTFRAIKYFYDSNFIRNIFDTEKEILQKTSYNDILAEYPKFLDASLYSIVIAGNTDSEAVRYILEESLGILAAQTTRNDSRRKESVPKPDFPAKTRKINLKIRHLFYTDVKAEDAGPMPAVLIPTKNFADPVQYWFKAPEADSEEAVIFDALILRLSENLNNAGAETKIFLPAKDFRCGGITFLNVEHTNYIEETYKKTLSEFVKKLEDSEPSVFEAEQTKNAWILSRLSGSKTNTGTARIISSSKTDEKNYLDEYEILERAGSKDFLRALNEYFPPEPLLQIFSSDSKK